VFDHFWHARSPYRLPDLLWRAAVNRIRAEFEEMPSLRVTLSEARRLFGLPDPAASWVLRRLAREGFLVRTARGQYIRRAAHP
jgi:predicted transcriptional regulator of viral defense system